MEKKILVVVDMQNDFIDGALGSKEAEKIVDKSIALNRQLTREDLILLNIKGF